MAGGAGRGKWWTKARGLPADVFGSLRLSLEAQPGREARILAWADAIDGYAVGTPAALSIGDESGWTHLGWHEIEKGDWNTETRSLRWVRYGGKPGSVQLSAPGRMPELFRERVGASIVLERFVPFSGNRGVIISGRRDLADPSAPIAWHSTLTRGLTWQTEGVQAAADAALAHLRTEYDMG